MPTASRARRRPARAKIHFTKAIAHDVWERTGLLVEVLLQVMEAEISQTGERSAQWQRLFGTKDSAVVILQKLVQVLADLQARAGIEAEPSELVEPVSGEELALLREWMAANAPNGVGEDGP